MILPAFSRGTSTCCAEIAPTAIKTQTTVPMATFPSMNAACDKPKRAWLASSYSHVAVKSCATLFPLNLHDRKRKTQPQFVLQKNLNVMQPELLELDAAKIMNVGGVAFHFLELKFHFRLREDILLIHSDDARPLFEFASAAAPARPNAQAQIIDRQRWRGDDIEHADQSIHAVELATDVLAQHATLQVGENCFCGFHRFLNRTAHQQNDQNDCQCDPVNCERRKSLRSHPAHEPRDYGKRNNERNNEPDREHDPLMRVHRQRRDVSFADCVAGRFERLEQIVARGHDHRWHRKKK